MRPTNTAEFLAFWDRKVASYLATLPGGPTKTAETNRLAAQRVAIAGLRADQELAPYPDGVTPVQIVASATLRTARRRPTVEEGAPR